MTTLMDQAIVTRLSTTPVKGLRIHERTEVAIARHGAVDDRAFLLADDQGHLRSVPAVGRLLQMTAKYDAETEQLALHSADELLCEAVVRLGRRTSVVTNGGRAIAAQEVIGPWSDLISEVCGQRLRLLKVVHAGAASDVAPVTLVGEGSLAELARRSGVECIDPRRFRMLIQFGPSLPHVEDGWAGQMLSVGDVRLRVGATVPRCTATTRDPERGARDLPVVRVLRGYRGVQRTGFGDGVPFGVYAEVLEPGVVRLGDRVTVHARHDGAAPVETAAG